MNVEHTHARVIKEHAAWKRKCDMKGKMDAQYLV